jgi:hypothetical protein
MNEQRDLFSTAVLLDQAELKAHAALYAAREQAAAEAPPVVVTAKARPVPQGGAAAARAMREKLVAEHREVVVEATSRFAKRGPGGAIPARSILRFRLSDLPKLVKPGGAESKS